MMCHFPRTRLYMTQHTFESQNTVDFVREICGSQPPPAMASAYQRTREMTLDELMLENRVIFLIGEINQASAARVMMQMLYLEDQKRGQQINLYINSPGGVVDDTLGNIRHDANDFIRCSNVLHWSRVQRCGRLALCWK